VHDVRISLRVNGQARETEVWPGESLLYALRERLGLPGSKNACEQGECGSCSVLLDGSLVCACLVLAAQAEGHDVVTVEGLAENGRLHRVQEAFVEAGAVQCGFCTPGLVVATADVGKNRREVGAKPRQKRASMGATLDRGWRVDSSPPMGGDLGLCSRWRGA
jgi:carbon-monoxide dehydrogenase small subunit